MIEFLYKNVLLITFCFLLFFGFYLLFGTTIKRENLKNYLKARMLLGSAFWVCGLMYFIQWKFDLRDNNWRDAVALHLAFCYLFALLLGICFISLLDHHYITSKRIKRVIVKSTFYLTYIGIFVYIKSDYITEVGLFIGAIYFLFDIGYTAYCILKIYRKTLSGMSNYFSDDMESTIHWFKNSIFYITIVGMTAPITTFTNKYIITLQCILMLLAYIYIYVCFTNYAVVISRAI